MRGLDGRVVGDGDDLGAVDHPVDVVAEDGHLLEGSLESALDLSLVVCKMCVMTDYAV